MSTGNLELNPIVKKRLTWRDIDFSVIIVMFLVIAVLIMFLVYPIGKMLLSSFLEQGKPFALHNLTLVNFSKFFTSNLYVQATINSINTSVASVIVSILLGLPLAYIMSRVAIPCKTLFTSLATLPIILPPFVGAYSWILLLGRNGFISFLLRQWFGITMPSIYGFTGITLAMSLCYYPYVFLMAQGALSVADPYLEESAMVMGASFWRRLRTVIIPLVLPSIAAGAITVFMRAIGNFGVPSILGGEYYTLPTLIFFQVAGYFNLNTASAISIVSILFSVLALLLMKYITARNAGVTMTTTTRAVKQINNPVVKTLSLVYVILLIVVSLAPHLTVLLAGFSERWAGTPWPTKLSLLNFQKIFISAIRPLENSLFLAVVATLLSIFFGTLIAYTTVKKKFKGRWLIDVMVMLPFILPGIVVGVAILAAFVKPPLYLAGTAYILIIAYFIRRMPYVFRSAVGSLSGMDPAMEQASTIMGASWGATFRRVTFPLITPSILAAGLLTFTTLIGELSTTMILYSANWKTVTVSIYEYLLEDKMGPACALGTIVTVVVLAGIMIANKLLGEKIGNMFRAG
ncbi:MAG TPA: iron ABC transporter permease [Bacillota bacterium]